MLEEGIAGFDGSVLVVSHDRYFLDRVCDQIVAFEDGEIFVQPGNYSYYLEKRKTRQQQEKSWANVAASDWVLTSKDLEEIDTLMNSHAGESRGVS